MSESPPKNKVRLYLRLDAELKRIIETAATWQGHSTTDFAIETLVERARAITREHDFTLLSNRDRKAFISMLDDESAGPNRALAAAARKYGEAPQ